MECRSFCQGSSGRVRGLPLNGAFALEGGMCSSLCCLFWGHKAEVWDQEQGQTYGDGRGLLSLDLRMQERREGMLSGRERESVGQSTGGELWGWFRCSSGTKLGAIRWQRAPQHRQVGPCVED